MRTLTVPWASLAVVLVAGALAAACQKDQEATPAADAGACAGIDGFVVSGDDLYSVTSETIQTVGARPYPMSNGHIDHRNLVTGVHETLMANLAIIGAGISLTESDVWVTTIDGLIRIPRSGGAPEDLRIPYPSVPLFANDARYELVVVDALDTDGGLDAGGSGDGGDAATPAGPTKRIVRVTATERRPLFDIGPDMQFGGIAVEGDRVVTFLACAGSLLCEAAGVYETSIASGSGTLTKIASFDTTTTPSATLPYASAIDMTVDRFVVLRRFGDRTNGARIVVATRQSAVFAPLYDSPIRLVGTTRAGETLYGCLSDSQNDPNDTGKKVVAIDLAAGTTRDLAIACTPQLGVRAGELYSLDHCGELVHEPLR
jgi:hypothetical protein